MAIGNAFLTPLAQEWLQLPVSKSSEALVLFSRDFFGLPRIRPVTKRLIG